MGLRGSREKALFVAGLGSFGCEFEVGRYEVGRGLGSVFAAIGVEWAGGALVMGGGKLVKFPIPKLGLVFKRSLEAEGRKRVVFTSGPMPLDKFSFDADGRMAVDLGIGRRDIGRGRPLDLPAAGLFSSMFECILLILGKSRVEATRDDLLDDEQRWENAAQEDSGSLISSTEAALAIAVEMDSWLRRSWLDPFNVTKAPTSRLQLPWAYSSFPEVGVCLAAVGILSLVPSYR